MTIDKSMFIVKYDEIGLDLRKIVNDEVERRTEQHNIELIKIKCELLNKTYQLTIKDNQITKLSTNNVILAAQIAERDNKIAKQVNEIAEQKKTINQFTKQLSELKAVLINQKSLFMSEFSDLKEILNRLTNNK
jgi:hypothetical protein